MLIVLVALYFTVTVAIGLYASRFVKSSGDYLVAGRSLPLYMNVATVFATWFGAETVLAVSSTFMKDGLGGVVGDPFGAASCLILVAIFFARPFYRLRLVTIGDFYRKRYNRTVEIGTGVAITLSYLGWTSAQLVALGIVISTVTGGAVTLAQGTVIGAIIVMGYTMSGGMWAIALTDIFQTVVIVLGLLYLAWLLGDMAGGFGAVIDEAANAGKFDFWPSASMRDWLAFLAAWATMAVGSIAQQDVFQRVTSAKDEKTAMRGTLLGGTFYLIFAFVPMFIAISALLIDPAKVQATLAADGTDFQLVLPQLILERTPLFAQVLFFGALLSAILSTASGALLAPTAVLTENVLKPLVGARITDQQALRLLRVILVLFTIGVTMFALLSESSMYQMVQNAYKVTLVAAFTPLVFGMFWTRATPQGALLSIVSGLAGWILAELVAPEALLPPQLVGLGAAMVAMIMGSLLPTMFGGHGHPEIVAAAAAPPAFSGQPADGNPGGSRPAA
jgi:solute:Na+ symporter, SSS family